ncbi:MAG: hypothetical protein ACYDCD_09830 [Candidatus Acidiferrales bacterium]
MGVGAYFLGRGASAAKSPEFQRLTFRRGIVQSARFGPDAQTILYAASWEGDPMDVFSARPDSAESRSLGLPPPSDILAVSPSGEIALLLARKTSARSRLAGRWPRCHWPEVRRGKS